MCPWDTQGIFSKDNFCPLHKWDFAFTHLLNALLVTRPLIPTLPHPLPKQPCSPATLYSGILNTWVFWLCARLSFPCEVGESGWVGRSICKQKTLLVRVYEWETHPATEPEERDAFVMEEDTTWHSPCGQSLYMGPACQIFLVTMGPRLRQEIMVAWERVQNTHGWYTGSS